MDYRIVEILEEISESNPNALTADGFDEAIIGIAYRIGMDPLVAYDTNIIHQILMERDEMTYEEAVEYFEYNIIGGWLGEGTPIFIDTKNSNNE